MAKYLGSLALNRIKSTPIYHEGQIDPVMFIRRKNKQDGSDYYERQRNM